MNGSYASGGTGARKRTSWTRDFAPLTIGNAISVNALTLVSVTQRPKLIGKKVGRKIREIEIDIRTKPYRRAVFRDRGLKNISLLLTNVWIGGMARCLAIRGPTKAIIETKTCADHERGDENR